MCVCKVLWDLWWQDVPKVFICIITGNNAIATERSSKYARKIYSKSKSLLMYREGKEKRNCQFFSLFRIPLLFMNISPYKMQIHWAWWIPVLKILNSLSFYFKLDMFSASVINSNSGWEVWMILGQLFPKSEGIFPWSWMGFA